MKKMVFVIALAAIALTSVSAFAQIDPAYQNDIGIYLDESGDTNWACLPINTPTDTYLVLSKLTANEVLGWEARISFANMFMLSFAHRGQAIDIGSRPDEHIVGFAAPLPAVGGAVVVADLQIMVTNTDSAYAFVMKSTSACSRTVCRRTSMAPALVTACTRSSVASMTPYSSSTTTVVPLLLKMLPSAV
jgi:hypothetical protein